MYDFFLNPQVINTKTCINLREEARTVWQKTKKKVPMFETQIKME